MMQDRPRFPLSSEQCELLAAFEAAGSLPELAKLVHKDASVLSRNLQSLAETGVLEKVKSRWVLTALGRQINHWTRRVAASQARILQQQSRLRLSGARQPFLSERSALVLVGVQQGFDDPLWGARNNPGAEEHIARLLSAWRQAARPVFHLHHRSKEPQSPLRPGTRGGEPKACAVPLTGERVLEKSGNSAFAGTTLAAELARGGHDTLVVLGFTTNHCVDATVRSAGDLGLNVFVVEDACVAFDRIAPDGTLVKAEQTQQVVMANLNQEFATVTWSEALLDPGPPAEELE